MKFTVIYVSSERKNYVKSNVCNLINKFEISCRSNDYISTGGTASIGIKSLEPNISGMRNKTGKSEMII